MEPISGNRRSSLQIAFAQSLYEESLEEASFLYEHRLRLLDDPEISFEYIGDPEERLEAHIDALVAGDDLALELLTKQAYEGDPGELHAAVSVFCRQNRANLIFTLLEKLDTSDSPRTQAFIDALNYELPASWRDQLIRLLPVCPRKNIPVIAGLIGYKRLPAEKELLRVLQENKTEELSAILRALGRLRSQSARPFLLSKYLANNDDHTSQSTALALLRMGEASALNYCLQAANSQSWPIPLLGLCGNRSTPSFLQKKCSLDKANPGSLLSLGFLGDTASIDLLLSHLADPKLAEPSATALNLITGAEIYEEAFIPEKNDKDELFEDELDKHRQGQVSIRSDGKPFGISVKRLSQKPNDWSLWWAENKTRFTKNVRYRNGKPYSPACLLENLQSERSPRAVRQAAYEELVIRYGADFPFETDMRLTQQRRAIAQYADWVQTNGRRFREGDWYFAARLM
jgi:uncharacterized protein (TIGR02270 family)